VVNSRRPGIRVARIPLPISDAGERMEHLWSPAGATGGNRWQKGRPRKALKQADPQPVATHGNRFGAHGKEGVDGSSPSEGSEKPRSGVTVQVAWAVRGRRLEVSRGRRWRGG
jgi:hypothetical protein